MCCIHEWFDLILCKNMENLKLSLGKITHNELEKKASTKLGVYDLKVEILTIV